MQSDFETLLKERSEKVNEEVLRFLPPEEGLAHQIAEAGNYSVRNGGKRLRPLLMESAYFLCKLAQDKDSLQKGAAAENAEKTGSAGQSKKNGEFSGCFAERSVLPPRETPPEIPAAEQRDPRALCAQYQQEYETLLAPFLAAIEMIHSFSLVHDDLPCMDNDTLRRGKPSTWAKYGEDIGTLAGDALSLYAFETAAKACCLGADSPGSGYGAADEAVSEEKRAGLRQERSLRVVRALGLLAGKAGIDGMIGGQTLDVILTGKKPNDEELDFIYRKKTGALLEASFMIGAVLAGADDRTVEALSEAASALGMAFQIRDDILDETSTQEELGKPIGSDERNQKVTYVTVHGLAGAEAEAEACVSRAQELIGGIAEYPFLQDLCTYMVSRSH